VTGRRFRRAVLAPVAVTLALVAGAPAASASPFPAAGLALPGGGFDAVGGPCGRPSVQGQGSTAGVSNQVCQGAGLTFNGPSIGQIATVIGPTIIGPAVIGTSVISAGDVAVGY
jgi:hypothetical protein